MSDFEKATKAFDALKAAERQPAQLALPILNGLIGLVQGSGEAPLEVEEARSGVHLLHCQCIQFPERPPLHRYRL
jgi:hypothetical protein